MAITEIIIQQKRRSEKILIIGERIPKGIVASEPIAARQISAATRRIWTPSGSFLGRLSKHLSYRRATDGYSKPKARRRNRARLCQRPSPEAPGFL